MIREIPIAELGALEEAANHFYASSKFLEGFSLTRFVQVWTALLTEKSGVIIAHEEDHRIVGAIGGMAHRDLYGEKVIAEEFFWFIRPEYRGAGILLYRAFEEWAKSKGAAELQMVHLLDLMPDRVSLFYRRQGFNPIETRYSKRLTA